MSLADSFDSEVANVSAKELATESATDSAPFDDSLELLELDDTRESLLERLLLFEFDFTDPQE